MFSIGKSSVGPYNAIHMHNPIRNYDLGSLRDIIANDLNPLSEKIGCVEFPASGNEKDVLIIFGGNLERFSMLSVARHAKCRIIYFQDAESFWYGGSSLLPSVFDIGMGLLEFLPKSRPIIFGQSSGGYAALIVSGMLKFSVAVSCSPQTFADKSLKENIRFSSTLNVQYTPDYLVDVADFLRHRTENKIIEIFVSASELNNPYTSHFWGDWLHASRLLGIPNLNINIAESSNHAIVWRRSDLFAELISDIMNGKGEENLQISVRKCLSGIAESLP
ncbi:hypothetical protein [Rhizobium paknamense]|uniref:Alpha/beta hydrolase n=1 Tax=Rhizobium paknamense TaxID=1206817 RepID=A0ABU0I9G9_9HYPH|nr:hypothetical protein [Rhizobium paknamense]MDQ0454878.1 hypothetical protein [Rhizobium paknamense]